ncbi:MAG: zinc-ribbon domain-containing protein, partial [Polyangiaceae bacterium]
MGATGGQGNQCGVCGQPVAPGAQFCGHCGATQPVAGAVQVQVPRAPTSAPVQPGAQTVMQIA